MLRMISIGGGYSITDSPDAVLAILLFADECLSRLTRDYSIGNDQWKNERNGYVSAVDEVSLPAFPNERVLVVVLPFIDPKKEKIGSLNIDNLCQSSDGIQSVAGGRVTAENACIFLERPLNRQVTFFGLRRILVFRGVMYDDWSGSKRNSPFC